MLLNKTRSVKIRTADNHTFITGDASQVKCHPHIPWRILVQFGAQTLHHRHTAFVSCVEFGGEEDIQRHSKRWTHFVSLYGLNSKRRLNTRQTVGCGIPSSLPALRVDSLGLRSKLSSIRLTFSSDTRGRPELVPLHRQPICSNWWFQRQMLFLVGGSMLKQRRNARCTAVADSVLMNSRKQKILYCIVAILLSTDTAARLWARRAL